MSETFQRENATFSLLLWRDHHSSCSMSPTCLWQPFLHCFILLFFFFFRMKPAVLKQIFPDDLRASSKALPAVLHVPKHSYYRGREKNCRQPCFEDKKICI